MKKVHPGGPVEVIALGRKGVYEISISLPENLVQIEALLKKYTNRPISLADACLIRCAEIHREARIFTFDSDFHIYRWNRSRKFDLLT